MNKITLILSLLFVIFSLSAYGDISENKNEREKMYYMPSETHEHEATWLIWPHSKTYEDNFREQYEDIWVAMTEALITGEKVNIVAYDAYEQKHIENILKNKNIRLNNIHFYQVPNDDFWARDTAPIFVFNQKNELNILGVKFNGWGRKVPYKKDQALSKKLSELIDIPLINIPNFILEGGAIELDHNKTLVTTRSSVTNKNRNPHLTEKEIEGYFKQYLSVSQVVWLDGVEGEDITDMHIDGFFKFLDEATIVTLDNQGFRDFGIPKKDIKKIKNMKNINNESYDYIQIPLTQKNVVLKSGENLGYKGSYINYYVANTVVLVPNYNDKNDPIANEIIQKLYPNRKIIGIDVRNIYKNGGMIHCLTQQQPKLWASFK